MLLRGLHQPDSPSTSSMMQGAEAFSEHRAPLLLINFLQQSAAPRPFPRSRQSLPPHVPQSTLQQIPSVSTPMRPLLHVFWATRSSTNKCACCRGMGVVLLVTQLQCLRLIITHMRSCRGNDPGTIIVRKSGTVRVYGNRSQSNPRLFAYCITNLGLSSIHFRSASSSTTKRSGLSNSTTTG